MATKKQQTGLGADAIFGTGKPPTEAKEQPKEPVSLRTTVMLPTDVLILLNRLKEQSILDGNRQTQGEIISDAIRTLGQLRSVKT